MYPLWSAATLPAARLPSYASSRLTAWQTHAVLQVLLGGEEFTKGEEGGWGGVHRYATLGAVRNL